MDIKKYSDGDKHYPQYVYEGCHYECAENLVQCGFLDFCGCGDPDRNLKYVMKCLMAIEDKKSVSKEFYDAASTKFFFYWADKEGLTEHGGCIPGWLTRKGEELLASLRSIEFYEE